MDMDDDYDMDLDLDYPMPRPLPSIARPRASRYDDMDEMYSQRSRASRYADIDEMYGQRSRPSIYDDIDEMYADRPRASRYADIDEMYTRRPRPSIYDDIDEMYVDRPRASRYDDIDEMYAYKIMRDIKKGRKLKDRLEEEEELYAGMALPELKKMAGIKMDRRRRSDNMAVRSKRYDMKKPMYMAYKPDKEPEPPKPPPGTTTVQNFKKKGEVLRVGKNSLDAATRILEKHGRVIICGLPGTGKTVLGLSLLKVFEDKGYTPKDQLEENHVCKALHNTMEPGTEDKYGFITLMDGLLGSTRLRRDIYQTCMDYIFTTQRLWDRPRPHPAHFPSLLIITVCPHILKEVKVMDEGAMVPLADPEVILLMTQDPTSPCLPFSPTLETYVRLITGMVKDEQYREVVVTVLTLVMNGVGNFLRDPEYTCKKVSSLGLKEASCFRLAELENFLRGILLKEEGVGFLNRTMYDAAGLAIGKNYSQDMTMSVCDPLFAAKHVRFDRESSSRSMCMVVSSFSDNIRERAMEMIYEAMVKQKALKEICQHPSLVYYAAVHEFADFCGDRKGLTEKLMSVEDSQHRLPLLYWSVWNMAPHLNYWCLTSMEDDIRNMKTLSKPMLISLLACVLFVEYRDRSQVSARDLVKDLVNTKFEHTEETLELTLPTPDFRDSEARVRFEQIKVRLRSGLCYLDDPGLPLPSSLLTAKLCEEGVHVQLPSKCWYLALRILSDQVKEESDEKGNTVMRLAVEAGDRDVIRIIVQSGVSLSTKNRKSAILSHFVGKKRKVVGKEAGGMESEILFRDLYRACESKDTDMVKVLLCQGLSVQDRDESDYTPLHVAAAAGLCDIVTLLLQLEADPKAKDIDGETALHIACRQGDREVAKTLLEHKADVNAKTRQGATPLHISCERGDREITALLIQHRADVNARDVEKLTPLYISSQEGHLDIVFELLQRRVDVKAKNGATGATALHAACKQGHVEVAKLLLQHGAKMDAKGSDGVTPADLVQELGWKDPVFQQLANGKPKS